MEYKKIYCGVNSKLYRKSWKETYGLTDIDSRFYSFNYYDAKINK